VRLFQVTSGVLEVHVPKTAPAKDKQQKINVA
jgi:HSP20 family molecular chaperone IbpA